MTARTRLTAVLAAIGTALVIGIPTDVVPNPWFGREIGVRAGIGSGIVGWFAVGIRPCSPRPTPAGQR